MANKSTSSQLFEVHVGEMVREAVKKSGMSVISFATSLNITAAGMQHRFSNPFYGTVYELIQASNLIKVDLVGQLRAKLSEEFPDIFNSSENEHLIQVNQKLRDSLEASKAEVRKLYEIIKIKEEL